MIISLNDIAIRYALLREESDSGHQLRYIMIARDVVKELKLYSDTHYVTVELDINPDNQTAKLPADYISYVRIGQVINGRILQFDYDRNMAIVNKPQETFCDEDGNELHGTNLYQTDIRHLENGVTPPYYPGNQFLWDNVFVGGQWAGRMYGVNASYPKLALFKIDHNNHFISFSTLVNSEYPVVMEYKSTGVGRFELNYVPETSEPAIIAGMRYYDALNKRRPNSDVNLHLREWKAQKKSFKAKRYGCSLHDLTTAIRSTIHTGRINR